MNFITLAFFIFLAVAALVYYILPRIARAAWLLCCSYVFYLYDPANAGYLVLLCAATLVTWGAGLVLERVQRPAARKAVLAVCVAVCIGSLGFYKYAGMVTQWLNGLWGLFGQKDAFTAPSFAVPLGISYFSFMALGCGLLGTVFMIWFFAVLLPFIWRGIKKLWGILFHRRKEEKAV